MNLINRCFIIFLSFGFFSCSESKILDSSISNFGIKTTKDKVWAHRVNTISNNYHRLDEFHGIEIDVFFNPDQNNFTVKHDLEKQGVNLESFLDSLLTYDKTPIWIDYKNMNKKTHDGIKILKQILQQRDLLNSCLIESYYLSALQKAKGHLHTSYWTGVNQLPESRESQDSLYNTKYKHLNLSDFSMLSANHNMYEFFSYYFPEVKCNYWLNGPLSQEQKNRIQMIASTPNTNIILVDEDINFLK